MLVLHPRHTALAAAFAAILVLVGSSGAAPKTYDFEGLATGSVVSGQTTNGQFLPHDPYPDFELSGIGNQSVNSLAIFNSANPTFADIDLGTPNVAFGGPGVGIGGGLGQPGQNNIAQKKILIIPENLTDLNRDGLIDSPDDNAHGGVMTIEWETPGVLKSITLVDMEEQGATLDLFMGNQLVQSFPIPALGDNSLVTMMTETTSPIDRTVLTLPGSGALASLVFDDEPNLGPSCNITGPDAVCLDFGGETRALTAAGLTTATFFTSIPDSLDLQWSATSVPPGICTIVGPTDGLSVNVGVTGIGTCTVMLTVTDPDVPDSSVTCEHVFLITEPPCAIAGPGTVCAGAQGLVYELSSSPGATFSTEIQGNGMIVGSTTGSTVQVNAGAAGSFTLTTTVNVDNCFAVCVTTVIVSPDPTCTIAGPDNACAGSVGNVYSVSGGTMESTYAWSVSGNGSISGAADGSSVNVTAGAAGSFTLQSIMTTGACVDTCTFPVTVNPSPDCSIVGPDSLCFGGQEAVFVILSGAVGATFSTEISGNGTIAGKVDSLVTVNLTAPGTFTLTTTVTAAGCTSTCQKTVTVLPAPDCDIDGPSTVCSGSAGNLFTITSGVAGATFSTEISGNGTISGPSTGSTVSVDAGASGSFTLVTTSVAGGCTSTCQVTVEITPGGTCSIAGADSVCAGSTRNVYEITSNLVDGVYATTISGNGSIVGPNDGPVVAVNAGASGSFTLTTTVTAAGCSSECTKTVIINPSPACTIEGPGEVCAGATGTLQVPAGIPNASYLWDIAGNGTLTGSVTGSSVSFEAGAAGSFTVTLSVEANGCSSTCETTVTVNPVPDCLISGPESVCSGSTGNVYTVTSSAAGAAFSTSISGNGSITGPNDGPTVTVEAGAAGSFTLTTTVTADGCSSTCTRTVTVNASGTCSIDGPESACTGSTGNVYVIETNLQNATYSTIISGNGSIVGPANGASVTVTAGAAGSFTLTTTVTAAGCSAVCMKVIPVNPDGDCSITGADAVCTGSTGNVFEIATSLQNATYSTTISGNGSIVGPSDGSSVTVTAGAAGSFTLTTTVSAAGCSAVCTKTVTVNPTPDCLISGPETVCSGSAGNVYTLTSSIGGATFSTMVSGNGSIVGASDGPSVTVEAGAAGSFTLTTTVTAAGCSAVCVRTVVVAAQATCTIEGPGEICAGDDGLVFEVAGAPAGAAYAWSISGDGTIVGSTGGSSVSVTAGNSGSFTLGVTVTAGACTSSCSVTRTVDDCVEDLGACRLTGGGCLDDDGRAGHKKHTFGGNVGESGEWEHVVRDRNDIVFNFHSHDAHADLCWRDDGDGPCSPRTEPNNINWSGTGRYSIGNGMRDQPATFTAHVQDRAEGACGGTDYYTITVYDLDGNTVFHAEGEITCGNLQLHKDNQAVDPETEPEPEPLSDTTLGNPSPNPFQNSTRISYRIEGDVAQSVAIGVFDVSGRLVKRLEEGSRSPGSHETVWDGRNESGDTAPGGIYFVRVMTGSTRAVKRLIFTP
jgi:hypothetical protein